MACRSKEADRSDRVARYLSTRVPRHWPWYITAPAAPGLQARRGNEAVWDSLDATAVIVGGGVVLALWGVALLALPIQAVR